MQRGAGMAALPCGSDLAVEQQDGMRALGDVVRDFVEMELHHVGVRIGQREGRPDAAGGADRAEQIGVVVALVGGPRRSIRPGPDGAALR